MESSSGVRRYDGADSLGDGFGSIHSNASATIRAILAAPLNNSAVRVPTDEISGVNVWALNQVAALGEFEVEFYVFRLNPVDWAHGDKIRQARGRGWPAGGAPHNPI